MCISNLSNKKKQNSGLLLPNLLELSKGSRAAERTGEGILFPPGSTLRDCLMESNCTSHYPGRRLCPTVTCIIGQMDWISMGSSVCASVELEVANLFSFEEKVTLNPSFFNSTSSWK